MAAPPRGDARKCRPLPVAKMAAAAAPAAQAGAGVGVGVGAGVGAVAVMAARGAEAEALFEAHTTAELRAAERRLRAGIEQKREELRQMVGERYRDLIEAADTIAEMRRSAERLLGAVRGLQRGGAARPGPASTARPPAHQSFYGAAAQLKLLLEVPEQLWGAVEGGRYLPAARLHLLGAHLRRQLQLDTPRARSSPILARFPILLRQVAAASHLRSTILQESKALLRCPTGSDQAVAEALCAIMLLEDSSPRQALADFLLARKLAIQQLLNQPHHGIKAQVCSLMELLTTTLYQAHAVFYTVPEGMAPDPALPCGLLFSTLESTTGQNPAGRGGVLEEDLKLSSWFKYLPESVVEFQPTLRTLAHPISQEYLRETLQQWITMCSDDIRTGVRTLLVYVKSMKGLAGIRDAVWELLSSESGSHSWEAVCRRLLDRPVSFWEELLQQLFLDRLQTLTKEGFDSISSSSKQLLALALQELEVKAGSCALSKQIQLEHNVALFLWSESPGDLPGDAAWVSVGQRGPFARSGLAMKAQALTPCVQSFCSTLDSKLKARLEDVLSYLPTDDSVPKEPAGPPRSAFDRFADAGTVQGLLRDHCVACIQHLLGCVREQLQSAQSQLGPPGDARLNAVLFMARLCQALPELCPHLQRCVLGQAGGAELAPKEPRSAKKLGKGKAQEVSPELAKWQGVKAELLQQSLLAYQLWSSAVTKGLVQGFTHTLLLDTAGSVLATATNWDEIEIQEETESGSSVTSKIRLPVQPSWHVQCLLFSLCQEVNRVGGHTLPKVTLQELLRSCLAEVLAAYEKLVEQKQEKRPDSFPLTQSRALQLLYDLRYLSIILTAKSEDTKPSRIKQDSGIEKVIDFLEGHIDPFDLDVFTPHLNGNLNRLVQRTSVLFGLLTGTENQYTSRGSALSSQELHNILPLASSQIRFGLLPLSMSSSRKSKSTARSTERVQGQAAAPVLPREDEAARPGSLFRQLVTEDEDTVAPSLFKLGWLSGMTK
ncbi:conserved oligomeric Golgi complex subunit 1 isoform X2 [Corvus moneduloides]|uniref:conserved oligomeric Golgi complex subunit 1 isoform X2 n=1 Tax=Corvus moneduloides TaxID=1196302 RepID=UPI001361F776|nr:conserved oligomeric Golgi complex subunit 1 isoform X2 [Corvus moneduloides]